MTSKSTTFDGDGIITSVVFKNNNITISGLPIQKSSFRFPLRYFKERNYVKMFSKIFSAYLVAFILFRFFDILKPSIIERIQHIDYGIGIMLDDIISGFLSLLIVYGIFY